MEPFTYHETKQKTTYIARKGRSKLLYTVLHAPIGQHFLSYVNLFSHVETDARLTGEVIYYILPVLCFQTLHHPLFMLNSANTLNLVPHVKLRSGKQNTGKVCKPNKGDVMFSMKKALSVTRILRLLFPFQQSYSQTQQIRVNTGTWRQHNIHKCLKNRTHPGPVSAIIYQIAVNWTSLIR